jgi:hypothetical protein
VTRCWCRRPPDELSGRATGGYASDVVARPLGLAAVAIVLAFAALYYLEHVYYPGQFR